MNNELKQKLFLMREVTFLSGQVYTCAYKRAAVMDAICQLTTADVRCMIISEVKRPLIVVAVKIYILSYYWIDYLLLKCPCNYKYTTFIIFTLFFDSKMFSQLSVTE